MKFTKMQGLGNDFVVIDAINQAIALTREQIQQIADRHFGVGCDQLLLVEKPVTSTADFKYRIFNADGSEVSQCGNGARCFARFVYDKKLTYKTEITVDTQVGQLILLLGEDDLVTVNMGIPEHLPSLIPIKAEQEKSLYTLTVNQAEINFAAVSMGNPHAVIQLNQLETATILSLGKRLEAHEFFPERANIGFMQVINRRQIKLRVYERGTGETLACGSGACAAVVAGIEQNLLDKEKVTVSLPGGDLLISWAGRGQPVWMTGAAASVFEGDIQL